MDLKSRYIKMRNERLYDINFFYDYYISEGGQLTDPNQFTENFLYNLIIKKTHPHLPAMVINTGERDKQLILDHMDKVFDLTILADKNKQFIKVV